MSSSTKKYSEKCEGCGGYIASTGHRCIQTSRPVIGITEAVSLADYIDTPINPSHYTDGGIEHWTYFKAKHTREECIGAARYCLSKYEIRLAKKGKPLEDARKLLWWANELARLLDEED